MLNFPLLLNQQDNGYWNTKKILETLPQLNPNT